MLLNYQQQTSSTLGITLDDFTSNEKAHLQPECLWKEKCYGLLRGRFLDNWSLKQKRKLNGNN
jgi:hypothetical protein